MFKDFSEAESYVREHNVRMVDLKFGDLWGRWHHVTIPTSEFTPALLTDGVGFDGSSVGFKSIRSGDMILVPDLSTGFPDPFCDVPTLSFICNTLDAESKTRFKGDPREVLRRADAYMKKTGIASESRWGPEFEFYIFNEVSFDNSINVASYRVDSTEANWHSANGGHGHYIPLHGGYHAIPPNDQLHGLRTKMVSKLEEVGISVKYHHHEVGGPGQCEIETPLMGMLAAADTVPLIKYVTKMVARSEGQTVTFLPKPLYGEAGNGMHFHQQLLLDKTNCFYDQDGPHLLSKTALYYIGGLLAHAPAVMAFTNPSTNSYRRLVPGFEAPVNCFFSSGNRSAAIRVPAYATQPEKVRFEFRPPDGTCNPYLALSAMLMAGLDGILNRIDPTAAGFGPIDEDIFSWSPEKRALIKSLPTSLEDAIHALQEDHEFLIQSGVFPSDLIENWIRSKVNEDYAVRSRPHPYEIQLYFDL